MICSHNGGKMSTLFTLYLFISEQVPIHRSPYGSTISIRHRTVYALRVGKTMEQETTSLRNSPLSRQRKRINVSNGDI